MDERVAKTLHQFYGPSEIQAWGDGNFDHETWRDDAKHIIALVQGAVVTDEMIQRGARALSDAVNGFHSHYCADHQEDDAPGLCVICRDDARAVLRAALEVTDDQ